MDFKLLKRADLQRLCIENKIKANGKNENLIAALEIYVQKKVSLPNRPLDVDNILYH